MWCLCTLIYWEGENADELFYGFQNSPKEFTWNEVTLNMYEIW